MKKFELTSLLPHVIAIVIFMIISGVYFNAEFSGKKMKQSDIVQFQGMSKEIKDYREKTGDEPLWTNSMFGGMPAYQISVRYPNPVLNPVNTSMLLGSRGGFGKVFLYMISFYILCMALRLDPWLGVLGAIAFGLSSYHLIILEAGHNAKALALGYLPGVVAGFLLIFKRKKYLIGALITSLFLGLQLLSNHPQMTYYMLLMLVLVGIAYAVEAGMKGEFMHVLKGLGIFTLASLLALGTASSRLMTNMEYAPSTVRGPSELSGNEENKTSGLDKDYATAWSYGIGESFTLLVPNFNGGGSGVMGNEKEAMKAVSRANRQLIAQNTNRYWGDQTFTSGPVYIGAIIFLLAFLGMFYIKGPLKYGLIAAALLTLMLSWGKNFMPLTDWFLDNFPMYNKFRAVSSILVVIEFIFPLLAVLGVHELAKNREEIKKNMVPVYAISGGIALLLIVMLISPTTFTSMHSNISPVPGQNEIQHLETQLTAANFTQSQANSVIDDLLAARESLLSADVTRSLILVLLGAGLIIAFLLSKFNSKVLFIGLGLLTLGDLWTVDKRYLNEENFEKASKVTNPIPESNVDNSIAQDPDLHYRVMNTQSRLDGDALTSYYHNSLGGYHGAKLRRYQDIIDRHLSRSNRKVIDMLNTKYVIGLDEQKQKSAQRNSNALGNAWFVSNIVSVNSPDEEIDKLNSFDPANEAVIDVNLMGEHRASAPAAGDYITLSSYDPKLMSYKSKASSDAYAVFSEIYYQPGWNAYLDGNLVEHQRVNYVLRGMDVPAGEHVIDFKFEPSSYSTGNTLVYISSLLLLLLVGWSAYTWYKGQDADMDDTDEYDRQIALKKK